MKHIQGYLEARRDRVPSAVAIGNFDGVHLGHQQLIHNVLQSAQQRGLRAAVYTFQPHPMHVLRKTPPPILLTTYEQKAQILESMGIDLLVEETFTPTYAQHTPQRFVEEVLCALHTTELFVGPDFRFGHKGQGTFQYLEQQGPRKGFQPHQVKAATFQQQRISSSRIREACLCGRFEDVHTMLGDPWQMSGLVVHGDGRGKTLGFPTANLQPIHTLLPPPGVYAGWGAWTQEWHPVAINVGMRPTFSAHTLQIEAHFPNQDVKLYQRPLCLAFAKPIRPEQKFDHVQALRTQIKQDIHALLQYTQAHTPPQRLPWLPNTPPQTP
ncbi:MAG: riboflavin biosynthesis protein RibF, partial [Myxococcota bacterium]